MDNFTELSSLVSESRKINEYITRAKSIKRFSHHSICHYVGIEDSKNNNYTLSGIASLIGEEKLDAIVQQFSGLVAVELYAVKERNEKELAKYEIVKND